MSAASSNKTTLIEVASVANCSEKGGLSREKTAKLRSVHNLDVEYLTEERAEEPAWHGSGRAGWQEIELL
jgi:hypothetical protein